MPATTVFRSLLVPLDGSTFAEQALPIAIEIAQAARASVRLVLVHQRFPTGKARADGSSTEARLATLKAERGYLQLVAKRVKDLTGTRVTAVTLDGPIAPTLREHIDQAGVDLVVMTTHGRGLLERAWLGSVADALVRTVDVPILLVRPVEGAPAAAGLEISRILVPLDGSPLSEQILPPAAAMARLLGAELSLIRLVVPVELPSDFPPGLMGYDARVTALLEEQAQDHLDNVAARLRLDGLRVTSAVGLTASVVSGILDLARDPAVGMVAVATHGHGGLRRAFLGSVADKVVRASDRPVLVYRPRPVRRTRTKK